jgi:hypothetical protein
VLPTNLVLYFREIIDLYRLRHMIWVMAQTIWVLQYNKQTWLPFFGVDPALVIDDEGYGICPENITEVQCYGKIVRTPDDAYDVNEMTAYCIPHCILKIRKIRYDYIRKVPSNTDVQHS